MEGNQHCMELLVEKFQNIFEQELIEEMCKNAKVRQFDADEIIMDLGQVINAVPIVLSGSLKIMRENDDGSELLLYYLEEGDICSISLGCCSKKQKSNIKAVSEVASTLLMVPVESILDWMARFGGWRSFIIDTYNIRFSEMLEAIDSLAFQNMEERIYKYLRDKVLISKEHTVRITHSEIAKDLNSSRVVISRLMKKLEIENKIVQHRNNVDVLEFE